MGPGPRGAGLVIHMPAGFGVIKPRAGCDLPLSGHVLLNISAGAPRPHHGFMAFLQHAFDKGAENAAAAVHGALREAFQKFIVRGVYGEGRA
jgi:hypothetical protein